MAEAVMEQLSVRRPPLGLRIAGKVAKLALGFAVASPFAVLIDSGIGYALSYRETNITQIDNSENEQDPQYDPNSATLFMNGFGEDLSCKQATTMKPAVGKYGKIFCLTYSSSWDKVADAEKAYDTIFGGEPTDTEKHLTVFASSMGDKRGEEMAGVMEQRHGVKLEGLIMNTGAGPFGMQRVINQMFKDHIAEYTCQHAPGKATMAAIQTVITEHLPGNQTDPGGPLEWIKKGFGYNNSVLQNQACTIQEELPQGVADTPPFETVAYMRPDNPMNDAIIDDLGAINDWKTLFPNLKEVSVAGNVTHDNVSYRPDAYLPVVSKLYEQMRDHRKMLETPLPRTRIR